MTWSARWVVALASLQAFLLGVYLLVEQQRESTSEVPLSTEAPQRVDMTMPRLDVVDRNGRGSELLPEGRRTLVHIWATWCPPCRAELPGFVALPSQHPVDVVAIALDANWNEVEAFLGGTDAANVVLAADEHLTDTLEVRNLPVTFLVEANGRVTARFDGARDWADEEFVRRHVLEPLNREPLNREPPNREPLRALQ